MERSAAPKQQQSPCIDKLDRQEIALLPLLRQAIWFCTHGYFCEEAREGGTAWTGERAKMPGGWVWQGVGRGEGVPPAAQGV